MFCYCLYGWGLSIIAAPLLYWAIAYFIAAFLVVAVNYSLLVAIPTTLGAGLFIATPLVLDTAIARGNDYLQSLANMARGGFLYAIFGFVISLLWFSPLFWSKREMGKKEFNRLQIFGFLTVNSWLGLSLGWLLGRWY